MSPKTRTEAFWHHGRLFPATSHRPKSRGPWPKRSHYLETERVAYISGDPGSIIIERGPAATDERLAEAFLFHLGLSPALLSPTIWNEIPAAVHEELQRRATTADNLLTRNWNNFSNEEARTGAYFSGLSGATTVGEWTVELSFFEFSKQTKETATGTDVAVVLDAKGIDGRRSFKTIWLQAKVDPSAESELKHYPRLPTQLETANGLCDSAFALIYTPDGARIRSNEIRNSIPFGLLLAETAECRHGDQRIETLMNSLNRQRLFQILITQKSQPRRRLLQIDDGAT